MLPAAARRTYRRTGADAPARRTRPPGHDREAAYHEARKAAKRARYAGEAVSPAFGKEARRFTKQMKKIQTVLGDHQDAVVARGVDRELGISAHLAGENAFTFGLLYDHEDQRAGRERRTWKRTPGPIDVIGPTDPAAVPAAGPAEPGSPARNIEPAERRPAPG